MKRRARQTLKCLLVAGLATFSLAAGAADPQNKQDESWITLNGTVVSTSDHEFILDYGTGLITVEMDDWGWYEDKGHLLIDGDKVTVHGRVDDGLFETGTIEAGSVYVEGLNTYFYANTADEEGDTDYVVTYTVARPAEDGNSVNITGIVEKVNGREFILDTGYGDIQVDTAAMGYNPLDNKGLQRLDRGDAVSVSGRLDVDFFERREIMADTIYSLDADVKKRDAEAQASKKSDKPDRKSRSS